MFEKLKKFVLCVLVGAIVTAMVDGNGELSVVLGESLLIGVGLWLVDQIDQEHYAELDF